MEHTILPQHVGISVADMDVSINWYGDILGFTQVFRTFVSHINCDIAVLRNGSFEIELFHHRDSRSLPKDRLHSDEDMITQGTKHMCFRVTELDSFVGKLRQKGVTIVMGPGTMGEIRFYYIADPSGVLIELIEPA